MGKINESSLSKIQKYRATFDTGAISTMRPYKTRAIARKEMNDLISTLKGMGFVCIKTMGYYQGGSEQSLFVADVENKGNLKDILKEFGKKYDQDSILFRPKGGKSRLIITRGKKFGNETKDSHTTSYGNSTSANYSKVGGRTFSDTIDIDDKWWPEDEEEKLMKKENIFRHELNESIQANAAMNCLKHRNNQQQMNEALPLVAGAIRLAMPLLRPLITKLVKSLVMKAGAKLTGRQVAKMVIKNVANGKTLMKVGKKVGQTWTEIPAELKQEIAKTAINTFKEMRQSKQPQIATQEQEETSEFDARFEFRKDLRELASPAAKKAYMIIRKQYGDNMWRQLYMDDCDERGLIDMLNMYAEKGLKPQQIVNKMLGSSEDEETVDYVSEQEEVNSVRSSLPVQYEQYVLPDICDMVSDKGISEEEVIARLLATPELPWEYDEIEDWVAEEFEKDVPSLAEIVGQIIADNMKKLEKMDFSQKEDFVFAALCKATNKNRKDMDLYEQDSYDETITSCLENVFGIEEQEETTLSESELEDLTFKLADYLMESFIILEDDDEDYPKLLEAVEKILRKDAPKSDTVAAYYAWCRKWFMKIEDLTYSYYNEPNPMSYYTDEEDEEIGINKHGMHNLVQHGHIMNTPSEHDEDEFEWVFDAARDIINKKFVGKSLTEIAPDQVKDDIRSMIMKEYKTRPKNAKEHNAWVHNIELAFDYATNYNFEREEQEELPSMERRDMILAITEVLDESFDVDDNDGDLDDIYYAVARFLNLMTYYTPKSEDEIMDWCREWHEDIAEIINTPADANVLKRFVNDAFECLLEEGGYPEFYDLPKEQVKQAIYKALCNTPESELPWGRHYAINAWTKANVQKIRKFLTK